MKHLLHSNTSKIVLTAVLFIIYGSCIAGGLDTLAVRNEVLKVHELMAEAGLNTDPSKMFEYILDAGPGTIIQNGILMESKAEALAAVKKGMEGVAYVKRSFDRIYVKILSADAALVSSSGKTVIELHDGRTFESPIALTEVFVRKNGTWKMIHGHHSVPPRQ